MGTPNFARPSNASKYFVVLTDREVEQRKCKECGEKHKDWEYNLSELTECQMEGCNGKLGKIKTKIHVPDSWEADDLIENLGYAIEEIGGTKENESIGNDRDYGVQSVGYLSQDKSFGDINLTLRITAVVQSAYYEGATLDWLVTLESDNETFKIGDNPWSEDKVDEAMDKIFDPYYTDMNAGMCKIQARNAENWAEQAITDLSEKIEAIFETYQEHKLECQGVFSNGEAVYRKVD